MKNEFLLNEMEYAQNISLAFLLAQKVPYLSIINYGKSKIHNSEKYKVFKCYKPICWNI